jgi:hypothetical protein
MSASPCVSVVMPVFNGERYLEEAVRSILDQTFSDFEFIIIDDGSTDRTRAILKSYTDGRIKVVDQRHRGIIASLNQGLAIARGQYVARMDSDDIAMPDRLDKQVAFLRANPEIGILGTACQLIDAHGRVLALRQWPLDDLGIHWASLLSSPFGHPTVMLYREILIKNGLKYTEAFQMVEDYDLWARALNYTRGRNLREPLLQYRVHDDHITSKFREVQLRNHDLVALCAIREQLPDFAITSEQVSQLREMFVGGSEPSRDLQARRAALARTYLDLLNAFVNHHPGEPGLEALQCEEALKVARLVFRWPLQPGSVRIGRRLMAMYPGLPWSFSGHLWSAVYRRLRPRALNSAPLQGGCGQSGDHQNNHVVQQRL